MIATKNQTVLSTKKIFRFQLIKLNLNKSIKIYLGLLIYSLFVYNLVNASSIQSREQVIEIVTFQYFATKNKQLRLVTQYLNTLLDGNYFVFSYG